MHNYLLFHSLAELTAATISFGTFLFAWNTRRHQNPYLLSVGCGALFVGVFEALHCLAFPGMAIFVAYDNNLSPQLWITARLFQVSAALLGLALFRRRVRGPGLLAGFGVASIALGVAVFSRWVPRVVCQPAALTPFKITVELLLVTAFLGASLLLYRFREEFAPGVFRLLVAHGVTMAACDLCFAVYTRPYDTANLVGHLLLLLAAGFHYAAILRVGLIEPTNAHFRELSAARDRLALSEEQYRLLFVANPCPMLLFDEQTLQIVDANEAAEQHYQWSRAEFLTMTVLDIRPPEDRDFALSVIRKNQGKRETSAGVHRHLRKDGSVMEMDVTGSSISVAGRALRLSSMNDITERRKAERALQQSEQRFRLALHNAPVSITAQDQNLRYIWAYNQKTLDPSTILGLRDHDIFRPEEADRLRAIKQHVLDEGVEQRAQMWIDGPLGRRFVDICFEPIRDDEGQPVGVGTAGFDLTPMKVAEDALRRYELVVQQSRDIILFMRLEDGRILEANPAATAAYGYSREELLALSIHDLRAPNSLTGIICEMRAADRTGVLFETTHRRRDGSTFPVEVSSRGAAMGDARALVSVVRDITERRRAELAEREHRQQVERRAAELLAIFESMAEPLLVTDAKGVIVRANSAFHGILGPPDEWEGHTIEERVRQLELQTEDGQPVELARTPGMRALLGETVHGVLQRWHRPDGSVFHVVTSAAPIRTEEGIIGAVVIFTDVSERVRAEQALLEADRAKNEFLAVLSHELRNPLAPIKNSLHVLERVAPGSEAARRAEAVVRRQVDQLVRLVDDLLDVTRITRNKVRLQCRRLVLNDLVRRTVEDYLSLFQKAGVRIEQRFPKETVYVHGDESRLSQVVGNLLQNAAKFTPRGGVVRMELDVLPDTHEVELRLADTGVGMAPEVLARLFQPFVQADMSLDRSKGGLGLGLALVRGLVELHGGRVWAHSEGLGHGSTFVVRLPAELEEKEPVSAGGSSRRVRPKRVLIIEDNVDAAQSLRDALVLGGHDVAVAYDGPDGIARAHAIRPDVVFCDIGLPGMNGYEVAQAIRTSNALSRTRLVALSGYALPEDIQRAEEAGFEGHLPKPPNLERLEQILN